jgi:cysteine-rich repeat protein
MKKIFIFLGSLAALMTFSIWASNAEAYEDYQGCVSCHPGFSGGRSDVTHSLHTGGGSPLTTNCDLCHTGSGRSNPLTLWSIYNSGNGYGCAGCHGRYYGETIDSNYSGFGIAGLPKSSAWGLRKVHNNGGVSECYDCHDTDGEPLPENQQPPYYADPNSGSNVIDPCADNLDNDGDGLWDVDDPDCAEVSICGDGTVDSGEQCDDGNTVNTDTCRNDCTLPYCPDGIIDPEEQCDDGNNIPGDGCESDCTLTPDPVCGDGIVNGDEECDNGVNNGNGCESDCTLPVSGSCSEADLPVVTEMEYNRGGKKLHLHGHAATDTSITIIDMETGETLAEGIRVRDGEWEIKIKDINRSLDKIRITSSNGCPVELWIGDDIENSEHQEDDKEYEEESENVNSRERGLSLGRGKHLND